MRYNSPSKQKFTLLGWTMGWIEWLILFGVLAYGVYDHFDKKPPPLTTVQEVESVFLGSDDDNTKSVDVWLMKYQLDFDRADKEYQDGRDLRFFKHSFLKKCLTEVAEKNGPRLSDAWVRECLEKADREAFAAQEYWKKK
jgi:hypothetical protein